MSEQHFTTSILIDYSPEQVFDAINNVRGWWSEDIKGGTSRLNDVFDYHFKDVHRCKIKIIESVPGQKVTWHVLENYFNFTEDKSEWTDTKPTFEITEKDGQTQLRFTHYGLVPGYECYDICNDAWSNYIKNSLHSLITTGRGMPNSSDNPQTENEKRLGAE